MPLVQTRGAASAQGFGEFAQATVANYIEDVFSTYLYTGNGSTGQTITNSIDLSTKGGLVWGKSRSNATDNSLVDTVRGNESIIYSNLTQAADTPIANTISFLSTGFSVKNNILNANGHTYASWTFRKQPKFFDVVTYTGTGSNTTIAHSLGSVPGSIIVKRTDTAAAWAVYHRSLANTQYLVLNTTAAAATGATWWNSTTPTSAVFSVGTDASVNASGGTYVAYLFAHDAGGFGLTGTDNVISCGSFTTDGSYNATVNLGYEPQWILVKNVSSAENWYLIDSMRGWSVAGNSPYLRASTSSSESSQPLGSPTATGFTITNFNASSTNIYIAIRRGPMKVPTLGTSVFSPNAASASAGTALVTNFPVDLSISTVRSGDTRFVSDRLRGVNSPGLTANQPWIATDSTGAELTNTSIPRGWDNTQILVPPYYSGSSAIWWNFRRAPSFFDEICYTGNLSTTPKPHNLTVPPELIIIKQRNGTYGWKVMYTSNISDSLVLESSAGLSGLNYLNSTQPTASAITIGPIGAVNNSGDTYVAYLFATLAGVSKVGSYTGNGTTQTINCGFTGGARFVLIKRTDSTGDWYVWDSARGIVAGNDPHLSLNTTAAEVTTDDSVDTDSTGFVVNQLSATDINVTSASYIFLSVA